MPDRDPRIGVLTRPQKRAIRLLTEIGSVHMSPPVRRHMIQRNTADSIVRRGIAKWLMPNVLVLCDTSNATIVTRGPDV